MRPEVRDRIKEFVEGVYTTAAPPAVRVVTPSTKVLEIGSLNVNGQMRDLFDGCAEYTGIDMVAGPGVDVVGKAHVVLDGQRPWADIAVYVDTAEHDPVFMRTLDAIGRVLKTDGLLVIAVPGQQFPEHERPDYWRFMKDAHEPMLYAADCTVERYVPLMSGWMAIGRRL